tara:strand:- start:236 stop:1663 length:1428 start_codon:yes stop_codon:yes gene_type:complete
MKIQELINTSAKGGTVIFFSVMLRVVIGFATQVALARMLAPEIFGDIAFVATIALFLNALSDLKADVYIIQQTTCDPQRAVNVAFTLELVAALAMLGFVFTFAPSVMSVLGREELTLYVQVLALSFLYNPFSRPRSLLERELKFLRAKIPSIVAQVIASGSALTLAYHNFGIWSLLWWRLCPMICEVTILWLNTSVKPKLCWDTAVAKALINFSGPLIASAFLSFISYNMDYFIVGHYLSDGSMELGYYWLGFQAAVYFLMARQVLYGVLFPVFSRIEDMHLKARAFRQFTHAVSGIFLVIVIFMVSYGRDLIMFVYGNRWEPAVLPFQIVMIVVLIRATNANLGYYFNSSGNTKPEFISSLLTTVLLAPAAYFGTIYFGIIGAASSVLVVQLITSTLLYEKYVKPMVGEGAFHYLARPCSIAIVCLITTLVLFECSAAIYVRILVTILLLMLAYLVLLKDVLADIRRALRMLLP